MGVLAPVILRPFGVPLAFGFLRLDRLNQHLSRTQYVWGFGVFAWGLGMFVFFTVGKYLEWKLLGDTASPMHINEWLLICLPLGWLTGVLTAPRRNRAEATRQ